MRPELTDKDRKSKIIKGKKIEIWLRVIGKKLHLVHLCTHK
ncbi:hypothetical protein N474_18035 [Pseudoalteromonas luteoviolacea CPMOR-2]|uniref:Uncharacterized protein n=1 Tax=Pseudoalteromonas luteoviolacea DSM 6061 TaxID=1365250 RepID=A0A161XV98_9GAMM|nr:hypothetical protein N475_18290 [Pseudoalteromonas luteoviolacea DSM 6061]KZN54251.1 hypothetical protein N474_18035 [Pseudoalteromonas luteoviolacea CPMOR-2]MBE0389150.1 hypothetical protein [Pseudoalteromonas luteoviolacea DSM 6061]